jgi:hypothetical protein
MVSQDQSSDKPYVRPLANICEQTDGETNELPHERNQNRRGYAAHTVRICVIAAIYFFG